MKLVKTILTVCLLFVAFSATAQKVKIKKGYAYVDGEKYVKVEKDAGNMSIYSLDDDEDELIYLKWYDPTPNNNQNHDDYYIVRFIESGKEVEIDDKTRKGIIKLLYKGKVIKDGKINQEKAEKFLNKYGTDSFRSRY